MARLVDVDQPGFNGQLEMAEGDDFFLDRFMGDQPAQAGATLTGGADGAEQNGAQGARLHGAHRAEQTQEPWACADSLGRSLRASANHYR